MYPWYRSPWELLLQSLMGLDLIRDMLDLTKVTLVLTRVTLVLHQGWTWRQKLHTVIPCHHLTWLSLPLTWCHHLPTLLLISSIHSFSPLWLVPLLLSYYLQHQPLPLCTLPHHRKSRVGGLVRSSWRWTSQICQYLKPNQLFQ